MNLRRLYRLRSIYTLISIAALGWASLAQAADFTPSGGRPYSAAVRLTVGSDFVMTSGGIAQPQDPRLSAEDPARYGDTYLQARSALQGHAQTLAALGLGREDVVYARAYLVADGAKGGDADEGVDAAKAVKAAKVHGLGSPRIRG